MKGRKERKWKAGGKDEWMDGWNRWKKLSSCQYSAITSLTQLQS